MKSEDNIRRIFLAVPAPAEIVSLQDKLRADNSSLKRVKWMRNHNIHLTVYFIGNVPAEQFETIIEAIIPVINTQKEFTLKYDSLCFAPSRKPRMIWVKYKKHDAFAFLSESIHYSLRKFIPRNKFYFKEPIPHITLARFHSMKNYRDIKLPERFFLPDIIVNSCELWETVREEGRSNYKNIMRFNFNRESYELN